MTGGPRERCQRRTKKNTSSTKSAAPPPNKNQRSWKLDKAGQCQFTAPGDIRPGQKSPNTRLWAFACKRKSATPLGNLQLHPTPSPSTQKTTAPSDRAQIYPDARAWSRNAATRSRKLSFHVAKPHWPWHFRIHPPPSLSKPTRTAIQYNSPTWRLQPSPLISRPHPVHERHRTKCTQLLLRLPPLLLSSGWLALTCKRVPSV